MINPNSIEEIDAYFENGWEKNGGPQQTLFFMQTLLNHLPKEIYQALSESHSIIDFGCATGEGVAILHAHFPNMRAIAGFDISKVAIHKAVDKYGHLDREIHFKDTGKGIAVENGPEVDFFLDGFGGQDWDKVKVDDMTKLNAKVSLICSNVLEHFTNLEEKLLSLALHRNHVLAVMTPYKEVDRIPGHEITITEDAFPKQLHHMKHEFNCIIQLPPFNPYWAGEQILAVYLKG